MSSISSKYPVGGLLEDAGVQVFAGTSFTSYPSVTPVASYLRTVLLPPWHFYKTGYRDIGTGLDSEILGSGLEQLCPWFGLVGIFNLAGIILSLVGCGKTRWASSFLCSSRDMLYFLGWCVQNRVCCKCAFSTSTSPLPAWWSWMSGSSWLSRRDPERWRRWQLFKVCLCSSDLVRENFFN